MKYYYLVIHFVLALININSFAQQAGDLDPSFGSNGIVLVDFDNLDDASYSVIVQPDGKIVLGGTSIDGNLRNMSLCRLNTDGTFDATFSGDGRLIISPITNPENGERVFLAGDRIIIVGYNEANYLPYNFALHKFTPTGGNDNTFGNGGEVETDFSGNNSQDAVYCGVLVGDKIIVAGAADQTGTNANFALARYNSDGSLDSLFGVAGKVSTDFATEQQDRINDIAVQSDGKIIAVGETAAQYPYPWSWALARYNPDGTPDNSFGTDGKVIQYWAGLYDGLDAIVLLSGGKFLVAGTAESNKTVVARYNSNGSLDNSFGTDGKTQIPGVNPSILVYGNKIFATSSLNGINGFDFLITRLEYDGQLDNTFGNGGTLSTTLSPNDDVAQDINIQPDGKILISGYSGFPGEYAVVRYLNDPFQPNAPFFIIDELYNQGFINFTQLGDPAVTDVNAVVFPNSLPPGALSKPSFTEGVVNRYYEIAVIPQNAGTNTNFNASLRLYYRDDEAQAIDESKLKLVRYTNDGWIYVGGTVNTDENYVEAIGVTAVGIFAFADPDSITSVDSDNDGSVNNFSLEQNYPNPFNPATKIRYSIPNVIASETKQSQLVSLKVYDVLGNEVAALVNEEIPAGSYEVEFTAPELSSGIYFYKLQTGSFVETKKMLMIK
jgi:uncharacterized delta-60 repeat protein